jgi:hypothetical protein
LVHVKLFFFFCFLSWVVPHSWGEPQDDLFLIELEVATQEEKERANEAKRALLRLLTKVTGVKSIPRSERVLAALNRPEAFYSGFSYRENNETQNFTITYNFDKSLVLDLVRRSNLPYWWGKRPNVIVWLALDEGTEKILSSSDRHVMGAFLRKRAKARGVSLKFPIMDVPDRRLVPYKELKSGIAYEIDAASLRYLGDVSLIGLAKTAESALDEPYFDGTWEFWFENEHFSIDFEGVTAREGARIGVDLIADVFAAKFAVFSGLENEYSWVISGITDLKKYADLRHYFEKLEIIDELFIIKLSSDQVTLKITSRASEKKIRELLLNKKVIVADSFHRGPNTRFRWGEG